jgi:serine/threonine protein kinase/tetratricopeptide (TPR) repeat protein
VREREIAIAALQQDDPAARQASIDLACGADADLRCRVEALLVAFNQVGSALLEPTEEPEATGAFDPTGSDHSTPTTATPVEGPGTVIGPYRLLEQIGEGGMGVIYVAEQTHPVRRRVALKIIKPGMDTRQVIARFEAERQALALMDHPNIARVLDAGTTAAGRPYFVMELVKGVPITTYCDTVRLPAKNRLELFVAVCQAIQHAHQKGIIHRDIKPSNVLVAMVDGNPTPKVIDFGVAKASDQRLTEQTVFTQHGSIVGTLEYMSPEQAELTGLDIDTRTDIYALGVLLYELLTGTTPLTREKVRQAPYPEILRRIREEEPPKPSTRLSDSDDRLASLAALRRTEPGRLTKQVRGELDWIVMKALDKDRTRRYETANGFARDIQRYLAEEPVEAGPPSATYRLFKLARRHRTGLAAVTAFVAMLLIAATLGIYLAIRATTAERLANDRLSAVEKAEAEARTQRDRARKAVDDMYTQVAERWLSDRSLLGRVQREFLGKALAFYEEFVRGPQSARDAMPELGRAYRRVGQIQAAMNQREPALAAFRRATEIFETLLEDDPGRAEYRCELAKSLYGLGNDGRYYGSDWPAHRRALAIRRALVEDFPGSREYRRDLASSYHEFWHGPERGEAESCLQRSLEISEALAAETPGDPDNRRTVAQTLIDMGYLHREAGRAAESESCFRRSVLLLRPLVERFPDRPEFRLNLAWSMRALGGLLLAGRPAREQRPTPWDHHDPGEVSVIPPGSDEAEAALREAEGMWASLAANFPDVAVFRDFLAGCHWHLAELMRVEGRLDEAETYYRQTVSVVEGDAAQDPASSHLRRSEILLCRGLAEVFRARAQPTNAEQYYRRAVDLSHKLVADFPSRSHGARQILAQRLTELGRFLAESGRTREAEPILGEALVVEESLSEERPELASDLTALARLLADSPMAQFRDPTRAVPWPGERLSWHRRTRWPGRSSASPSIAQVPGMQLCRLYRGRSIGLPTARRSSGSSWRWRIDSWATGTRLVRG